MFTFWKRSAKEEGISCVMRIKDECDWVRLSILSILDFADEIVFVDNGSTDGTLELVRALKDDWGIAKLKLFTFPPIDGVKIKTHQLYNFAFGQATKTWVFKWDGDFIARTNQRYSIMELKEMWGEYRQRADVLRIGGPNLMPTTPTTSPNRPTTSNTASSATSSATGAGATRCTRSTRTSCSRPTAASCTWVPWPTPTIPASTSTTSRDSNPTRRSPTAPPSASGGNTPNSTRAA
jgi:hypothetical protein